MRTEAWPLYLYMLKNGLQGAVQLVWILQFLPNVREKTKRKKSCSFGSVTGTETRFSLKLAVGSQHELKTQFVSSETLTLCL